MTQNSTYTFPQLTTKRLKLRRLLMSDSKDVFQLRTDKEVNTFIERPTTRTEKSGEEFVARINKSIANNSVYQWVISLQENSKLLGTICLWNFKEDKTVAEVGYDLFPQYQGQGIMTEALSEVLNFGFNAGFKSIEAFTHIENKASIKLLIKNGFFEDKNRNDKENANNIIFIKQND
ncbi:GNAT family N-acetyltransferase [Olleya sp. AH-315-F22]|nr:GNAT family N-acetyltransferase [Olleya sp. AH-315-F22]